MTGIIDWASSRARMILAFIVLSLAAGALAYVSLPKEGEPDIEIPALFVSVPFPGISAADAEKLLVQPMESELSDLDGLTKISGTAAEGYAGVALEFEFGWDKTQIIADVRDRMGRVEAEFPEGAETYTVNEINFSEFPILIVNLTGNLPERTLLRVAQDLQDTIEGLEPILEAGLAGHRDEMLEVVIDPLKLEAYNVTAAELISVVRNNNQLIAAGEVSTASGSFAVKVPSSFDDPQDVFELPVKTNGDRVVTLGDLADIRLTFEDREGTARFNGENTVALQIVKRKGFNIIDTANLVHETVETAMAAWPADLQAAISVDFSNDQSRTVGSMVSQLEGSVLTAIALVMIVVLGALGIRSALLVGFAIPTSFMLCFVLLALMDVAISNIVMFGLILAVGMLVDGAVVVVEYADRRIKEGTGPMHAYVEAAKRMFWPIVSSTATTLCAFLPMLFWPGVVGEFMGMLPVTLIFVLSASLIVALIYLPIVGGVFGRTSRMFENASNRLRPLPWVVRAALVPPMLYLVFLGTMQALNPDYLFIPFGTQNPMSGVLSVVPGALIFFFGAVMSSITLGAAKVERKAQRIRAGFRRSPFGYFIRFISGNPVMPLVTVGIVVFFMISVMGYFSQNSKGVEFFVESEPEQAIVYVLQRGNLSLEEKDAAVQAAENIVRSVEGVQSVFAFAGRGGLNNNTGGAQPPRDTIGQVQIELIPWEDRPDKNALDGDLVLAEIEQRLAELPGIHTEILNLSRGPASAKPVHLRLGSDDWDALLEATTRARAHFDMMPGLSAVEDTLPLPGIDWQINVDVEEAGRYGADVATVGGMIQLITRGLMLDTMRVDSSDEEIEIRVRLPEEYRVLSTLDTLKVRTRDGLVPLSNFISREPVAKLAQIDRFNQERIFDIKAAVDPGLTSLAVVETGPDGQDFLRSIAVLRALDEEADAAGTRANFRFAEGDSAASEFGYELLWAEDGRTAQDLRDLRADSTVSTRLEPVTPGERIAQLSHWLANPDSLPDGVGFEWTGDQEDQEESQAFLLQAFAGALGLMFIILLAQFNSFYNSVLVLIAVVSSTTGVLIGMLVMDQAFSIIMTGTGIVALAGIVVNNNIVLIDTYQEYSRYMPRVEAIARTAQARIRPVLLTTVTTMAGLTPMMLGISLDFINGGYSIDSPTALWWKQLATAVVFGLGVATVLTLVLTPALLAVRAWFSIYLQWFAQLLAAMSLGRASRAAHDLALRRAASRLRSPEIIWEYGPPAEAEPEEQVGTEAETTAAPEPTRKRQKPAADTAEQIEADTNAEAEAEAEKGATQEEPTKGGSGGIKAAE